MIGRFLRCARTVRCRFFWSARVGSEGARESALRPGVGPFRAPVQWSVELAMVALQRCPSGRQLRVDGLLRLDRSYDRTCWPARARSFFWLGDAGDLFLFRRACSFFLFLLGRHQRFATSFSVNRHGGNTLWVLIPLALWCSDERWKRLICFNPM